MISNELNTKFVLSAVGIGVGVSTLGFLLIMTGLAGYRTYSVWSMEMQGKAKLAEATQSRQIQIEQAKGEREAASLRAEAISIVGKAAKEFPEYRQQEFIGSFAEALKEGKIHQIMYVPTEANIPITEANRLLNLEKYMRKDW